MKLKFEAPKGHRYKRGRFNNTDGGRTNVFCGMCPMDRSRLWYDNHDRIWKNCEDATLNRCDMSSHEDNIFSVRAFRSRLKKHSKYLPNGTKFALVSRIEGNEVYGETI